MKTALLLTVLLLAGCAHNTMIDASGITPADKDMQVRHQNFRDLQEGDDVFDRHDLCYASHYTLKRKHDYLTDWSLNVAPHPKKKD